MDLEAEKAAIYKVDSMLVATLNARDLETWMTFLADDIKMMPPNAPVIEGKDAIRPMVEELLKIPDFYVSHKPYAVVVSEEGDMAYIWYAYELTVGEEAGTPIVDKGKDISIYRKQRNGSWKLVVDIWNNN
jgi:ketosteroid isomerase-like protein